MVEIAVGLRPVVGLLAASLAFAAWLGLAAPAAAQSCAGTVSPPAGTVCGLPLPAPAGTKRAVYSYRGVPYAQPPVGDLRWTRPQPLPPWTGTLQATSFGAICPQEGAPAPESEDCLFLNVWTPQAAVARNKRLPVMVFLHGGAFVYGAGSLPLYDGAYLAASGEVVVVTLNYRLGALGFLAVPEFDLRGNFGIQDQRKALRWVAENIAAFGGDPRKVTIFGESAGAMAVGLHLFSIPQNRSRFRAAIMESNPLAVPYPSLAVQVEAKWQEFRSALCFETNQPADCTFDLAALRAASLDLIETADGDYQSLGTIFGRIQVPAPIANLLPWTPIVDGQIFATGPTLIQSQPYQGFYHGPNGTAAPKPYLIGVNRDEGALFVDLVNQTGTITPAQYQLLLSVVFGAATGTQITSFTANGSQPYSAADQGTLPPWFAGAPAAAAASTTLNDFSFRCGSFLTTDRVLASPGAKPVHAYLFAQAPIFTSDGSTACAPFPSQPGSQNACHSFELPYVFNTLSATNAATIPPANATLARRIARHWANFARDLDPGRAWDPYRATPLPGGNRIEVLSTGTTATGALSVPTDPVGASNCTALWATLPPFTGSFPAN